MKELTAIECICPFCGRTTPISVNLQDYKDWQNGKCVQHAFPYLNSAAREVVKTGLCYECQAKIFGE